MAIEPLFIFAPPISFESVANVHDQLLIHPLKDKGVTVQRKAYATPPNRYPSCEGFLFMANGNHIFKKRELTNVIVLAAGVL